MADSGRIALLSQRSIHLEEEDDDHDESISCVLDRITAIFRAVLTKHNLAVVSGPVAAFLVFLVSKYHGIDATKQTKIGPMLGGVVWMAIWWILEPVPIAVTSLLPLALFPFFGIMESGAVAAEYMNDTNVLMLGTFILALAIEKYNLHKRMALKILLIAGGKAMNPRLVLLGFLAGPAFVSMWMSNSSAAAMMLPMASGFLKNLKPESHVEPPRRTKSSASMPPTIEDGMKGKHDEATSDEEGEEQRTDAEAAIHSYSQGVIIAVTFGTVLGGMMTTIGSGPNLVLPGVYEERFPDAPGISFLGWMKFSTALVIPWTALLWMYLCWRYCPQNSKRVLESCLNRNMIEKDYRGLGPISFAEKFILTEFAALVLLWATRSFGTSPGWGEFFGYFPNDGTVAVAAAILLFLVPINKDGEMLINWKTCKNLSWNVILLLGGGFALSKAIQVSGLSDWIGLNMEYLSIVPYYLLTPVLVTIISFITEFSSNAATATLFLPIFAEVAVSINIHPLLLMLPATFASNCAFVLPSGTPTTAIAFGTGFLNVHSIFHPGMVMHVLSVVLLSVLVPTLGDYLFGLDSALTWGT